jgi:transposase InsO family protein
LYSLVQAVHRFRYIVHRGQGVTFLTDHANLKEILMSGPGVDTKRYIAEKIQRWKLRISSIKYRVIFVPGKDNLVADMLSRLKNSNKVDVKCRLIQLMGSALDPGFKIPTLKEIQEAQANDPEALQHTLDPKDGLRKTKEKKIFVPNREKLRDRLIVLTHSGRHKGAKSTWWLLKDIFEWPNMAKQIREVVKSCIHCGISKSAYMKKVPKGHLLRATRPRQRIGLDFYHPVTEQGKEKRVVLTIKDDFSGFIWLRVVSTETVGEVTKALAEWVGLFGYPKAIHSDKGPQFTAKVLERLRKKMKIRHVMSFPDIHYTNGVVERVHQDVESSCVHYCLSSS